MVPRYFAIFWRYRYHKSTDGTGTDTKKVLRYRYRGTLVPRYCPPMPVAHSASQIIKQNSRMGSLLSNKFYFRYEINFKTFHQNQNSLMRTACCSKSL